MMNTWNTKTFEEMQHYSVNINRVHISCSVQIY